MVISSTDRNVPHAQLVAILAALLELARSEGRVDGARQVQAAIGATIAIAKAAA